MKIASSPYHPDHEITSGQRQIKTDGEKYQFLFPKADGMDTIVHTDGEVSDTLKQIEQVVRQYAGDTQKIAGVLKGETTEATLRAVWDFLYNNIQYKLDAPGTEQLRRPARSWRDRQTGIDCDCFSIFCSSILANLGIAHNFRVTRYSQNHWQHIYVIVPKPGKNGYWTIDAVLSRFDYEKPYTQKMDYAMSLDGIKIAVLSGTENISPAVTDTGRIVMNSMQLAAANHPALNAAVFGVDLQGSGILAGDDLFMGSVDNTQLQQGLYRYLVATREAISEHPITAYVAGYNQQEILRMLDYAIHYWFTDKRDEALGQLMANEAVLDELSGFGNLSGLISDDDLYGDDDILTGEEGIDALGKTNTGPKKKKKGFFKKIGAGLKKMGKGLMRFNPATIAARNGFLLALKLNVGKMSTKLKWAYATPEQAKAKNIGLSVVENAKKALLKIEKLFTKIGGKPANLKKAILSGKKGKLSGPGSLGIVPVAAAVAAATPIITAVIKILKDSGVVKPDENVDISQTGGEATEDDGISFDDSTTGSESITVTDAGQSPDIVEGLGSIADSAMTFARNNPMLGLAIGGVAAFGIYKLLSSGDEKQRSSGPAQPPQPLNGPVAPPGKPIPYLLD